MPRNYMSPGRRTLKKLIGQSYPAWEWIGNRLVSIPGGRYLGTSYESTFVPYTSNEIRNEARYKDAEG